MRILRALIFVAISAHVVLAQTAPAGAAQDWKQRTFQASADEVFQAAEKAILRHHKIKFKEERGRVIRFHVGTTAWSWS